MAARGRQDNLSFFAFTATPKNKTLQLFGELGSDGFYRPFHVYSMRQAIEEGYILDVLANYVTYRTYFKLAKTKAEDPDVDKAQAAKAIARFKDLHPSNLAQRAEIVVEHFGRVTRHKIGGNGKAMVVTRSRLHAVKFRQAVDDYLARKGYTDLQALVAFSPGRFDPDRPGEVITESEFNILPDGTRLQESALPQYFEETDKAALLIVAEKYQTGFDQPLLHTMYVDKKLEGVKAVQTLSRLNRTHAGKEDTFILDFVNTVEEIQDAFRPFYEATVTEPTDPNLVYDTWAAIEEYAVIDVGDAEAFARAFFVDPDPRNHPLLYGHLEPAITRWHALPDDDAREEFRRRLQSFVRLYAFIAQVVPFSDAELERAYVYCRFLALRLPTPEQRGIDLTGELELTHLRIELSGEHNASLGEGSGQTPIPGFTGTGAGHTADSVEVRLSTIIETLNERFGLDVTDADRLTFEQWVETAVEDQQLAEQARVNTKDNFRFGFEERFEDIVMDSHERASELFDKFLADGVFASAVREWALDEAYRRLRGQAPDAAA
jgi:type I restriction enzyme R subunit